MDFLQNIMAIQFRIILNIGNANNHHIIYHNGKTLKLTSNRNFQCVQARFENYKYSDKLNHKHNNNNNNSKDNQETTEDNDDLIFKHTCATIIILIHMNIAKQNHLVC